MDYVCGFLRLTGVATDHRDRILLLRKLKPAWQKSLLNGVGGKVEPHEKPSTAMAREWYEESGSGLIVPWKHFAHLKFVGGASVHFFKAQSSEPEHFELHGRKNDVGERFEALPLDHALRRDDVIPNLKWLIPLAFLDTCEQSVLVDEVERVIP